jgi:hypothetical protein
MRAQIGPRFVPFAAHQRGQAMLLVAVLIAVGTAAIIFSAVGSTSVSIANQQARDTAAELARVKEALIGWSASRTPTASNPNARPGELPCPDTDNNGFAENDDNNDGTDDASCTAGAVGRVPWKTLGIPEPKDDAGETLWYAISGNFRVYRNAAPNILTSPITSDTLGTITVYQESTSNTITNQAVAVIFTPGMALGTQDRSATTTMSCAAPSGTYFRNQCASNYLESYGGVNNAAINGPFIRGPSSSTFNDRLLVITTADLMPVVEQRVAREMMIILQNYRTATGFYPWADIQDGDSNDGQNRARFPCGNATPYNWGRSTSPVTPSLPGWLTNRCGNDGWASIIYYAAGSSALDSGCSSCTSGYASLKVDGVFGTDLVLLTPGAASASPRGTWTNNPGDPITGYFEDSENSNNNNDDYVTPTSTAYDRDRIFKFP